ncbi:nucleotidyltransferase family protein [Brucella rhizosphaerae]|uniref:nucleotidyltransferase family protein n=1 Tax=Brucella rhizosphaerae TaxID=571254 RepID=UPI00361A6C41
MDHLRYSGLSERVQKEHFSRIIKADPVLWDALHHVHSLNLADWWLVSGALYNSVWNALTGRPYGYGIKDIDVAYFDDRDISWEAEDKVIQAGASVFAGFPLPVEIRNQARVHLWFEKRFNQPYMPLRCASEIDRALCSYCALCGCPSGK